MVLFPCYLLRYQLLFLLFCFESVDEIPKLTTQMETTGHYRPLCDTAPFSIFCKQNSGRFCFPLFFFLFVVVYVRYSWLQKGRLFQFFTSLFILVYDTSVNCKNINKKA